MFLVLFPMSSFNPGRWYIVELTRRADVADVDEYGELYFKQIGVVYVEYYAGNGEKQMVLIETDDVEEWLDIAYQGAGLQYFEDVGILSGVIQNIRQTGTGRSGRPVNAQAESDIAAQYDLKRLEPKRGLQDLDGDLGKLNQEEVKTFLSAYIQHDKELVERSMPSAEQNKDIGIALARKVEADMRPRLLAPDLRVERAERSITHLAKGVLAVADAREVLYESTARDKDVDTILFWNFCDSPVNGYRSWKPLGHMLYIVAASVIAGIGLATNSGPVVVASMLVSSMMEPIKGMTTSFKCDTRNMKRFCKHTVQLVIDTVLCIIFGAIIGGIVIGKGNDAGYTITEALCDNDDWPRMVNASDPRVKLPAEMSGRTKVLGLGISAIIAAASAVALTIADKAQNKSALVGIGISASLLPPAVNCGMLLVFDGQGKVPFHDETNSFGEQAWTSLALTFVNVGIIIVVWALGDFIRDKVNKMRFRDKYRYINQVVNQQVGRATRPGNEDDVPGEEHTPLIRF